MAKIVTIFFDRYGVINHKQPTTSNPVRVRVLAESQGCDQTAWESRDSYHHRNESACSSGLMSIVSLAYIH